ncbi:ABC transporter substrate-binding protein [Aestuariibacter salexigens]|uniref:ABC transporter substrate-binding protein n=1 Tax=Aestuariibacter salexigens TaxID=226010 RepID=UPI003B839654
MNRSRRKALKTISKLSLAGVAAAKAPYVFARQSTVLRVLGTHVTLQDELREQAERDLGFSIQFEPRGSAAVLQKASMFPESFDLYEQWSDSINVLWQAGAIQPIEKARLTYWNEINSLTKTGQLRPDAKIGAGDAPNRILNIQPDDSLGSEPTDKISFLPYVHNVDSFGYDTRVIPKGVPYKTESWGWLLDESNRGKVGIVNAPTIGIFDLILAVQAKGLMTFNDISNLSIDELNALFDIIGEYKRAGHFSGYWTSVPESVDFMKSGRTTIQSMFSPGISALKGNGIPVVYAAPKEGYRGWHGVMCLSSQTQGRSKDMAYDYMNWWLSGWPGAFIARQGYYISNPQRSKPLLSQYEWDYWYEGKPAKSELRGTDGNISVGKGETRTGGSYVERFSNVAVWNTVMPNYDYSLQKWYEFIS